MITSSLRQRILSVWSDNPSSPFSLGLASLSLGYRALIRLREACYQSGIFRTRSLPVPVIGVGNLTSGGTGKTPTVEQVARTLLELGWRPAILSRGYGRTSAGIIAVSDGARLLVSPREAGDEPFLLARHLPTVPVVVGAHRYRAGRFCLDQFHPDVLILDDAYQHRTLKKDAEILLIHGGDPWGNGWLLPRGPLREPLNAMQRASLIVVTGLRTSESLQPILERIQRYPPSAQVLMAEYEVSAPVSLNPNQPGYDGRPLFAFCGIANPESFRRTLADADLTVTGFTSFPDHHWYSEEDLQGLAEEARRCGASGLITTEKDGVRCESIPLPLPLWVAPIRLLLKGDQKAWRDHLLAVMNQRAHEAA